MTGMPQRLSVDLHPARRSAIVAAVGPAEPATAPAPVLDRRRGHHRPRAQEVFKRSLMPAPPRYPAEQPRGRRAVHLRGFQRRQAIRSSRSSNRTGLPKADCCHCLSRPSSRPPRSAQRPPSSGSRRGLPNQARIQRHERVAGTGPSPPAKLLGDPDAAEANCLNARRDCGSFTSGAAAVRSKQAKGVEQKSGRRRCR